MLGRAVAVILRMVVVLLYGTVERVTVQNMNLGGVILEGGVVSFTAKRVWESFKMRVAAGTGALLVLVMKVGCVMGPNLADVVLASRKAAAVTVWTMTAMAGLTAGTLSALARPAVQTYSVVLEFARKTIPTAAVQCILSVLQRMS